MPRSIFPSRSLLWLVSLPLSLAFLLFAGAPAADSSPFAFASDAPTPDAPRFILQNTGTKVRGRVLYPDGKPAAGIRVTAHTTLTLTRNANHSATTRADGTYELGNLEEGQFVLAVAPPTSDWAVATSSKIQLKASQNYLVDDIILSHGVVLTGYAREVGTKAPIVGLSVTATTTTGITSTATSDGQGRYQMRVQPGDVRFSLETAPIDFPYQYLAPSQVSVTEESYIAPNFLLRRGLTLAGTAKDETGHPAVGALVCLAKYSADVPAPVDARGNWTLRGIDPNLYKPQDIFQIRILGGWGLQSSVAGSLPAPSLHLVLRRRKLPNVKVRVVTLQDQPIVGTHVHYQLSPYAGTQGWTQHETLSNAQGEVTLSQFHPTQSAILSAIKKGYILTRKGQIASTESSNDVSVDTELLRTTDIVMTRLDAKVTGRVLDAQGQPAQGARVALLFPHDLRDLPDGSVLTNDKGQFTLTDLPQGEVVIGAARGRAFGQLTLQANHPAELRLGKEVPSPAPQDKETAFALLERWNRESRDKNYAATGRPFVPLSTLIVKFVPYDAERALRTATYGSGEVDQYFAMESPLYLVQSDPQRALKWGKNLIPRIEDAHFRTATAVNLAIRTAALDPIRARQVYDVVATSIVPTDFSGDSVGQYGSMAALASALDDPDAEGWLQAINVCLDRASPAQRDGYLNEIIMPLAEGNLARARKWTKQLDLKTQIQALGGLVSWAVKHDLPAAQQMLSEMETTIRRPDFPLEPVQEGSDSYASTVYLNTARAKVVRALMATDLRAAQELVSHLPDVYRSPFGPLSLQAEILARRANTYHQEAAHNALAMARYGEENRAGNMAFIASLISDSLPRLSDQAFKAARATLSYHTDEGWGYDGEPVAFYAAMRASSAPAESRLLLENEWLRATNALRQAPVGRDGKRLGASEPLALMADVARAMISLDIARADAMRWAGYTMCRDLKIRGNSPSFADSIPLQTINWLLADAKTRRTKPFIPSFGVQDED